VSTAPPPNPYPAPYPPTTAQIFAPRAAAPATSRAARSASHALRRRATVDQGRALEKLGHAIEYLIDSRLYGRSGSPPLYDPDDREAEQLLAHLSRTVFADCREIAPPMQRLKTWLLNG
jgi:hypothetical protein